LVLHKKTYSGLLFFISAFGVSQFYISFFGEGYRDLAKHLFPMNFSFDLILFVIAMIWFGQVKEWFARSKA
jgi:TM2 domain-containing membrane protein YozV